jgi:membrane protein DedA with SNARE-associated domain/rhodanese-related sulfurtransferase
MPVALSFFIHYGYIVLFLWIAAEQLGMPLPSVPLLITAGTLTATHQMRLSLVVAAAVAACLISDSLWYYMGKRFGGAVVRLLCKLSLESTTCVSRTENRFQKYGAWALLFAKFVPGLSTVAAPLAGQTGMPFQKFFQADFAGALLWSLSMTLIGRFFGDVMKHHPNALHTLTQSAGVLFLLVIIALLASRVLKQRAFLQQLRGSKIEPEELKAMLDQGLEVHIIDLRHPLDYLPDPRMLPGAELLTPETLVARSESIPRDRDIVLYCTCPSDATSARMALRLRKLGIYRVRPLRGGFEAWKKLSYPLVEIKHPTAA